LNHSSEWGVSPCRGVVRMDFQGEEAASKLLDLNWAPLWGSGFSPFLFTLWQATTATKTAMVITALRQAQNQNRRHPEIIMVGSAVVITRIIPRSPRQTRGQTFRRLPHRPGRRRRARRSSLRLHLPQHRKPTARFTRSGSEKNFAAAFVFVQEVRQMREFRRDKKASRTDFVDQLFECWRPVTNKKIWADARF
jgi:hypothetical protein